MPSRRKNPNDNIDADAIALAEKQRSALELRKAGATYDDIARALGYADRSGAQRLVREAFDRITRETAEETLTLELERLDGMLLALWPKAKKGDAYAVDRVLRIMERRSKYQGLDAPASVQLSGDLTVQYQLITDGQVDIEGALT